LSKGVKALHGILTLVDVLASLLVVMAGPESTRLTTAVLAATLANVVSEAAVVWEPHFLQTLHYAFLDQRIVIRDLLALPCFLMNLLLLVAVLQEELRVI
jgi:hypothetical protein